MGADIWHLYQRSSLLDRYVNQPVASCSRYS